MKEKSETMDPVMLQSYEILQKLGQGGYGEVWKVRNKQTSSIYALKRVYDAFRNSTDSQRAYRQIKYLQKLNHPNIVNLISFALSQNSKDLYVTLECMDYDLSTVIKYGILKEIHRHFIFYQIANGVSYIHSAHLIHRDLKPSNILINQNSEVKICDLGLIRSVLPSEPGKEVTMTQNIATRWYRAPELLLCSSNYSKPIDIWGLGCILAEMYMGRPIFKGSSAISQLQAIFEVIGKPTKDELYFIRSQASKSIVESLNVDKTTSLRQIFKKEDKNFIDLLEKIFIIDPAKRITISEVMTHPFVSVFKGVLQQKKVNQTIKILYDDRQLTPENYKMLLRNELEDHQWKKSQAERSNPSTYYESTITQSLPNNSRQQFFETFGPLGKVNKFSPQRETKNYQDIIGKYIHNPQMVNLIKKEKKQTHVVEQEKNIFQKNLGKGKEIYKNHCNHMKMHNPMGFPVMRVNSPFKNTNTKQVHFVSPIRKTPSPQKCERPCSKKKLSLQHIKRAAKDIHNERLFGKINFGNCEIGPQRDLFINKFSPVKYAKKSLSPSSMMDRKVVELLNEPVLRRAVTKMEEKREKVPTFIRNRAKYKSRSPENSDIKIVSESKHQRGITDTEPQQKLKKPYVSQNYLKMFQSNHRRSQKFLKAPEAEYARQ